MPSTHNPNGIIIWFVVGNQRASTLGQCVYRRNFFGLPIADSIVWETFLIPPRVDRKVLGCTLTPLLVFLDLGRRGNRLGKRNGRIDSKA